MIDLSQKYSQLVSQLETLNNKLDKFINGTKVETVVTGGGTVKTLSGIIDDLNKFKFVQKLIEHKDYADMLADDINIETELLVRVWGDSDSTKNGVYRKTAANTYVKTFYDQYDGLALPQVSFTTSGFSVNEADFILATYKLPKTASNNYTVHHKSIDFRGDFTNSVNQRVMAGYFRGNLTLVSVAGSAQGTIQDYSLSSFIFNPNVSEFDPSEPNIDVFVDSTDPSFFIFTVIAYSVLNDASGLRLPTRMNITFDISPSDTNFTVVNEAMPIEA